MNTNYTYDALSRLLSVVHQQGLIGAGTSYSYDAAGNRTSRTDFAVGAGQVVTSYGYDPLYQLTQAVVSTVPPTTTETYTYDKVGNRLSSLGVPALAYNSSNQLLSAQITPLVAANFTYDANGNTLTRSAGGLTTSNGWDFENRLTSVTLPGTAGTVAFKYDPFGRRILRSSPATTRVFVYDGDNILEASAAFLTPNLNPQWLLFISLQACARAEVERLVAPSELLRELGGDKHPADRVPSHFTVCGARASRARPPSAALAREMDSPPCQ